MARTVLICAKSFVTSSDGYQRDLALNPVQNRSRVTGICTVSSYTTGGEAFTPTDLGLNNIDDLSLTAQFINNTQFPTFAVPLYAAWTGSKVILMKDAIASGEANSGQKAAFWFEATGASLEGQPAL
jgi:hypothetical protein